MAAMNKNIFSLISLIAILAVLVSCTKTSGENMNEVPQEEQDKNVQASPEPLPTDAAAVVDSDLNQNVVDAEISDLEKDLESW